MITGDRLVLRKRLAEDGRTTSPDSQTPNADDEGDVNTYQKYLKSIFGILKVVLVFVVLVIFDIVWIYWGTRLFSTADAPIIISGIVLSFLLYVMIKSFGYTFRYFDPNLNEAIAKAILWPCFFICLFVLPTIYYSPKINGSINPYNIFGVNRLNKEVENKNDTAPSIQRKRTQSIFSPVQNLITEAEVVGKGSGEIVCATDSYYIEYDDVVKTIAPDPKQAFRVYEGGHWIEVLGSHEVAMKNWQKMAEEKKAGPGKFCYAIQAPDGVKIKVEVWRLTTQ